MLAEVITDGLSIRVAPNPFAKLRTELSRGDLVQITEWGKQRVPGERWHAVRVKSKANGNTDDNGVTGFAWAPGLRLVRIDPTPVPEPGPLPPPAPQPEPPPEPEVVPTLGGLFAIVGAIIGVVVLGLLWLLKH